MALPSGYTKIDYIQATGTQYIDTGVKADQTYSLEVKFQTTQTSSGGIAVSDTNWQSGGFGIWCNAVAFGNQTSQDPVLSGNLPIVAKLSQDGLVLDGVTAWTPTSTTFSVSYNMTLFALNRSGSLSEYLSGRIYYVKISSGDTLIRDFVPCINADGVIGLYDQVGSQFYGNSGTGVFFASPQKQSLPSGYTQVEYIQSSGTQYVDTGYKAGSTTRLLMDFEPTTLASSHQMAAGVRNTTSGGNQFVIGWTGHKSPAVWRSDFGSSQVSFTTSISGAVRHSLDKNGNVCTMDGTSVTNTSSTFTSAYNLVLFAGNTGGSVSEQMSTKLYSCKIYNDSVLVRNFVPCVNVAGVVGLYDTVGKQFYQNAGAGTFTAGDALPDTSGVYVKINGTWKQVNSISVKAVT